MDKVVVIEVLDRFGKIRHRYRMTEFPCRIGRGYNNDVIVDDNYVSADHLVLDFDPEGRLLARDLNSDNGMYAVAPLKRVDSMLLRSGSRLRIGHTELQFFFPDHPVREVILDRATPSLPMMFVTSWPAMLLVWLLTAVVVLLQEYLASAETTDWLDLGITLVPMFVFLTIWAAGWSIASRAITHRFYFAYHAILIGSVVILSGVVETLGEYVEFAFMWPGMATVISIVAGTLLFGFLLYGHLRYTTTLNQKKTVRIAASLAIGLSLLTQTVVWVFERDFDFALDYSIPLKPPAFVASAPQDIDSYFAAVGDLKPELERLRADDD
jgi:pSer/pThr/pTyr-binding forkhead associated (FHA) protein